MDRVLPGNRLTDDDLPSNVFLDLADMLRPMTGEPAPADGMPSIADWLQGRLEDDELTDLAQGTSVAPPAQRYEALAILKDLRVDGAEGHCHGDASMGNILIG